MGILKKVKDRAVEQMALVYLNSTLLVPYGRATTVQLDSTAKTIRIIVELKGETVPLEVKVTDYEISQKGKRHIAVIREIRTSREWLTALAKSYLQNVPLELPAQVGRLLARSL